MKHGNLSYNHNKEDKATRFSDIRTPVKFGKPRGFPDALNRYGHVFFKKITFCIDRSFFPVLIASRFSCSFPLKLLQIRLPGIKIAG